MRKGSVSVMNDFQTLLNSFFVKYLAVERGLSENTSKNYRDTFIQLLQFMEEVQHISPSKIQMENFDCNIINEFLDWLETKKQVSVSTRNNRLAGIKSFFQYVIRHEPKYISRCSGIISIPSKKTIHKPMNYMTISAFELFLSAFDRKTKEGIRDLSIISLLYDSGARVSELTNIRRFELRDTLPATLVLHGKGGKSRIVPVDKSIAAILSMYIQLYDIRQEEYLFFNSKRQKLTRKGIGYILEKYFARAKALSPESFPDTISPHCIRHSRAMHLLENGVNLIYIRDLLGHSSVTTTEIYSKANPEIKRKHIQDATNQLIDSEDYSKEAKDDLMEWLKNNI